MKRRQFLTIGGAAAAGITLGKYGIGRLLPPRQDPSVSGPNHQGIRDDREVLSVCGGCAAGCALVARIVDGNLVGVRGNPLCPLGVGGLCARGVSEVEAFYDPDRLTGPVKRSGARGGGWGKSSWEAALGEIATKIQALKGAGRGARVGVVLSSGDGAAAAVARRVLAGLDSPHVYHVDPLRDEAAGAFTALSLGALRPHGYDLDHTDLILSFGTPVLEGWLSPAFVARRFGRGRTREHGRLRLIQISSHLTPTAMRADEWIRCAPGREPTVALALCSILLREGLVDQDAVAHMVGLDSWKDAQGMEHPGFARVLKYVHTPHAAAVDTGIEVVELLRLARAFARADAPVAVGERTAGSAGVFGLASAHLLNALRGRIGTRGGVMFPDEVPVRGLEGPTTSKPRLDTAPTAVVAGTPFWSVLGAMERAGQAAPFDVLFIEDGAALGGTLKGSAARAALAKIPLVVSFSTALDVSAEVADFILPATTNFEQHTEVVTAPAGAFTALAVSAAALPPLVDGRPIMEVLLDLGRRTGDKGLPWKSCAQVIKHRLSGLWAAGRGMPYASPFQQDWMAQLEGAGWWTRTAKDEASFLQQVLERGGWVEPYLPERAPTDEHPYWVDGRARGGLKGNALFPMKAVDDVWLPRAEMPDPSTSEAGGEMALVAVAVGTARGRGTPNRASLLQIAAPHVEGAFRPWAELNTKDAARLGVRGGGRVRISSSHGAVELDARVYAGTRPGTVGVPWAPDVPGGGRYSKGWGDDAAALAVGTVSALIGSGLAQGLRVRVQVIKEGAS